MPLRFKIDILAALKEKGYSSYRLANDKIMGNGSIQKLRRNEVLGADGISTICQLLNCQPGDILEYIPDEQDTKDSDPK